MNERTANPVAPRTTAPTRIAFVIVASIAAIVHVRAAQMRTAGLLEHDEAISLLAAAGKSEQAYALYEDQTADPPIERSAASLQQLLRPTGDTGFGDVSASLRAYDIHPPLYFWLLHASQRCGVRSETLLRLLGSIMLLLAACILDRLVWPASNPVVRLFAFAILLLSPTMIGVAIELRQYPILLPGVALSLAALVQTSDPKQIERTVVALLMIAPAMLLWTHFGTIVWIAVWAIAVLLLARSCGLRRIRSIAVGLTIAALAGVPLLVLYGPLLVVRSAQSDAHALTLATAGFNVFANSAKLLVTLPWRVQSTWLAVAPLALAFIAAAWLSRQRRRCDAVQLAAVALWLLLWSMLLAIGKLPPHAVTTKYLLVPAIGLTAVLVRSISSESSVRVATVVGAIALVSHLIALPGALKLPTDAPIAAALHDVRMLIVNDPKRGYLLPIADELPASAKVIIARPIRAPNDLQSPLLVLEVKPLPDFPASVAAGQLREFLDSQYEQREVLADGPRRRMTLYRDRRTSADAFGTE